MLIQRMIVFNKCNNVTENRDISEIINALINKQKMKIYDLCGSLETFT